MANFIIPIKPDPTEVASSELSSELRRTTKSYIVVQVADLEAFIQENLGYPYDIQAREGLWDECRPFNVTSLHPDCYAMVRWKDLKEGDNGLQFILRLILWGLCTEGKIPAGDYLIMT